MPRALTALLISLQHNELQLHVIEAVKAVLEADACKPLQDARQALLDDPNSDVREAAVTGLSPLGAIPKNGTS